MNIFLNGEPQTLATQATVLELLKGLCLADKRVAVEINGDIVPRSQHATYTLAEQDKVEIVVAVGGG
jgi:sulfur carrier protein